MAKTHMRKGPHPNPLYAFPRCAPSAQVPAGYALPEAEFRNAIVAELGGDNKRIARRLQYAQSRLCARCVRMALKESP